MKQNIYEWNVVIPGMALCQWCQTEINYGSSGKKSFKGHAKHAKHIKARRGIRTNQSLPSFFMETESCASGIDSSTSIRNDAGVTSCTLP